MNDQKPLWTPSEENVKSAVVTEFAHYCGERSGVDLAAYADLHVWSITHRADFWSAIWDFCGVKGHKGEILLQNGDAMPGAKFFPDAKLNFAQTCSVRLVVAMHYIPR